MFFNLFAEGIYLILCKCGQSYAGQTGLSIEPARVESHLPELIIQLKNVVSKLSTRRELCLITCCMPGPQIGWTEVEK